jgi:hypothetical protein
LRPVIIHFCVGLILLPPVFAAPIGITNVAPVGTATVLNGSILRLVPNHDTGGAAAPAGAAWLTSPVLISKQFWTSFDFHLWGFNGYTDQDGRPTGDGFAFVIQNDPASDRALGAGAGGLGYMYIRNSIAIEFDAYHNAEYYGDPNGNHIAVNTTGTAPNMPHHVCAEAHLADLQLSEVPCESPTIGMNSELTFDLRDAAVHHAKIAYDGTALWVYVDGVLQLTTPINIGSVLDLQGGKSALIGFTASGRYSYENADITNWSSSSIPEPPALGLITAGLGALWIRGRRGRFGRPRTS